MFLIRAQYIMGNNLILGVILLVLIYGAVALKKSDSVREKNLIISKLLLSVICIYLIALFIMILLQILV